MNLICIEWTESLKQIICIYHRWEFFEIFIPYFNTVLYYLSLLQSRHNPNSSIMLYVMFSYETENIETIQKSMNTKTSTLARIYKHLSIQKKEWVWNFLISKNDDSVDLVISFLISNIFLHQFKTGKLSISLLLIHCFEELQTLWLRLT